MQTFRFDCGEITAASFRARAGKKGGGGQDYPTPLGAGLVLIQSAQSTQFTFGKRAAKPSGIGTTRVVA